MALGWGCTSEMDELIVRIVMTDSGSFVAIKVVGRANSMFGAQCGGR
jgi:hypothetical protein